MTRLSVWLQCCLVAIGMGGFSVVYLQNRQAADYLTRVSADISMILYFLALCLIIVEHVSARWYWLIACVAFQIHVLIAFDEVHGWSHSKGVEHVREASGFGYGIFASYFFAIWWLVDAVWWIASPKGYSQRSRLARWGTQVFFAFMVVNGTIVYESGAIRWYSLYCFGVVLFVIVKKYLQNRKTGVYSADEMGKIA